MKLPNWSTKTASIILLALFLATACETATPSPTSVSTVASSSTAIATPPSSNTPVSQETGALPAATRAQPTSTSVPASTTAPTAAPTATAQATATPAPARFSGTEALKQVQALAGRIGSRPSGSPAAASAAAYIRDQFAAMGYDARLEPYKATSFVERSSKLVLTKPQQIELTAAALVNSGAGSVSGQVAYSGLGRPADFPAGGLQGKVALVDRGGGLTFQAKMENAVAGGASAVIIANDRQGELRGSLPRAATVPVVSVLQVDGQRLQEFIRQGPTAVTITVDATLTAREGANVVATAGSAPNRKMVIIGAHYDSVAAGPGANDNASGVASVLQLAAATRGRTYPFDLVFVAFGDEEVGLVGSKQYVSAMSSQQRSQLVAMLNFDMVGVGDAMQFGGEQLLAGQARQIARDLGYKTEEMSARDGRSSDHASFVDAGLPAVFIYRSDDPNYHTALDTPDRIVPANLEAAGTIALRVLDTLARRN